MSGAAAAEVLDLRGRPAAEQLREAHEAVERAAAGGGARILTDLDIVATYVLPQAAQRGLRCRVDPPDGGTRSLQLSPAGGAAAPAGAPQGEPATESAAESGEREG